MAVFTPLVPKFCCIILGELRLGCSRSKTIPLACHPSSQLVEPRLCSEIFPPIFHLPFPQPFTSIMPIFVHVLNSFSGSLPSSAGIHTSPTVAWPYISIATQERNSTRNSNLKMSGEHRSTVMTNSGGHNLHLAIGHASSIDDEGERFPPFGPSAKIRS